jgi:hypothetical protein
MIDIGAKGRALGIRVAHRQTGIDTSDRYKETSTGGLAVNVVEC